MNKVSHDSFLHFHHQSKAFIDLVSKSGKRCFQTAYTSGGSRQAPARDGILNLLERKKFQKIFPTPAPEIIQQLQQINNNSSAYAAYVGFDATGPSLHVGHLLPLIGLIRIQRAGYQPIAIIGTATALIGDPSGRPWERDAVSVDTVEHNAICLEENIRRIFEHHEQLHWPNTSRKKLLPLKVIQNNEWQSKWGLVEFLSTVGRHFRVGEFLRRESVKLRMENEEGISLAEFCYQAFQAYDWYYLLNKYNCVFQIGGSDQLGNMCAGYDLIRRLTDDKSVYALAVPLLTNVLGDKLGKTQGSAVWLDDEQTSPFDMYQYFLRLHDTEVADRLRLLTFINDDELEQILDAHARNPEARRAQKALAEHVTRLVHGEAGLKLAQDCSSMFFNTSSNATEMLAKMHPKEIAKNFKGLGFFRELLMERGTTIKQMALRMQCFADEVDAERVIRAGGFYVNHQKVLNPDAVLMLGEHVLPNNISLLRVGKKTHYVAYWSNM